MSETIPCGWQRRSLIALGNYENGFAFNDRHWSELGLPIVRIAQITGSQGIVDRYPGQLPDTFRIDTGDLIFSWSGTLAVVRWTGGPAWLNQHLFKVIPDTCIETSLLFHLLKASVADMGKRTHGSTMKHIKRGELREFFVNFPTDRDEQQKLAQILDTLDTAIHETEAIIAKLKAIKQGLLHDLLTRGIDANGELRPPQTEAPHLYKESPLGWIPKRWEVDTLRDAALPHRDSFIDGDWIESPFITSEGIRLIQTGNIGVGKFLDKIDSRRFISEASFRMLNCKWVKAGDILICRLADPIGRACVVPEYVGPAITSVDCTIFRIDAESFSREFVLAWVNADASLKRAQDNAAGSTRSRISRSNLGMLPIAKPPLHEQKFIASVLQSSAKRIANEEAELSKFKETKFALMDDLLTGRVRVTPLLVEASQQ